ncbi:hypothetical protein [Methanovulcanius yangii]|uniref:hypothetical protein n=1 Tax=Methanovulcanius yangii TaxID=1789227 RepID=UPI0029CA2525|nr:hypothetical protein [Methanovulcanius yangii]
MQRPTARTAYRGVQCGVPGRDGCVRPRPAWAATAIYSSAISQGICEQKDTC